jgi:hypothetical protein
MYLSIVPNQTFMFNYFKTKMDEWKRPNSFHQWMEFDPNKLPETELDYVPMSYLNKMKTKSKKKK